MWKCKKCGEEVEDNFDACWKCQTDNGKPPAAEGAFPPSAEGADPRPVRRSGRALGEQMQKRYGDAYGVARGSIFIGSVTKNVAIIIVALSVLFAIVSGAGFLRVGGIFGVFAGLLLYVGGVLISSQGQILLTSLDGAINSSHFLTDSERAGIMRIELEKSE